VIDEVLYFSKSITSKKLKEIYKNSRR